MKIKAILFDFDGVILDSLNVKTQAFHDMYLPYGEEIASKVAKHHLENGGVSRYEKFKIYHQEYLGITINDETVNQLSNEFSERVMQGVINSSEVKGIRNTLDSLYGNIKMYIITGTPTSEIIEITKSTNLYHYFEEIYGSPEKKDFWTKKILKENQYSNSEVVFVGDATTDYEAAINNGVHFILREHSDNIKYFEDKNVIRIQNFLSFESILSSI